jgi:hypothetical protein
MWKTAPAQLDARPMLRSDLAALWLKESQAPPGIADVTQMLHLLRAKLIACEGLEVSQTLVLLERLVAWLTRAPAESAPGAVVSASEAHADVLTLYTDTTPIMEWPALARVAGRWTFAFGKDHVFLPPPDVGPDADASAPDVLPHATGAARGSA